MTEHQGIPLIQTTSKAAEYLIIGHLALTGTPSRSSVYTLGFHAVLSPSRFHLLSLWLTCSSCKQHHPSAQLRRCAASQHHHAASHKTVECSPLDIRSHAQGRTCGYCSRCCVLLSGRAGLCNVDRCCWSCLAHVIARAPTRAGHRPMAAQASCTMPSVAECEKNKHCFSSAQCAVNMSEE